MLSHQVTSSLRRLLRSYLTAFHASQQYKACVKEAYIYPATCYRSYTRKSEFPINYSDQLPIDGTKTTNADDFGHFKAHKHDKVVDIEKLYSDPILSLITIYKFVSQELNNEEHISFKIEKVSGTSMPAFKCTIDITWPEKLSFVHVGSSKRIVRKRAALKCLDWLYSNKKINGRKPLMYQPADIQTLLNETIRISLAPEFKNGIRTLIDDFDNNVKPLVTTPAAADFNEAILNDPQANAPSFDMMDEYRERRNAILLDRLQRRKPNDKDLPIFNWKEKILQSLENNQFLVIKGDTGCGKSTQVPQFIIDEFTRKGKAQECNILVSEPRRISAVSLAQRVASERSEQLGSVVGYHVRLMKVLPRTPGSIVYCTTGMLLQKIRANPKMEGVSHVILDEAHERTLQIDILLSLLKNVSSINPELKVIIMSATMNAELFQRYLSCPVIDVPGKIFPVKMHFLEDIEAFKADSGIKNDSMELSIPYEKIVQLIEWIVKNKSPGAILCFLPGWYEITHLRHLLSHASPRYYILPLHSKLSAEDQQKVFEPVANCFQKIILATDIAETGITVQDVSYVIDSAMKKEMMWNSKNYMNSMSTEWVSQANICQRKGRAGRVKPGESYHLITRSVYDKLDTYPIAEIHKISLEGAIILSKIYSDKKVNDFFSNMPEPPHEVSVAKAVGGLQDLGVLDADGNLTPLGKRITYFTMDPRLSRALLFSCVFRCLNPILSLIVMSTIDSEVRSTSLTGKSTIREQKLKFHKTSDHIAVIKYLEECKNCETTSSRNTNFNKLDKIYELHLGELTDSGMVSTVEDCEHINAHDKNNELIRAVLFAATNHLIKHSNFGYKKGQFTKSADVFRAEYNGKIMLRASSVNYKRKTWPSHFLTFISRTEQVEHRACVIPDTSIISPLTVLLFSQNKIICKNASSDEDVVINIDKLRNVEFCSDKETAELLLKFRDILWNTVNYIIQYEGVSDVKENLQLVKSYKDRLVILLVEVLMESSKEIDVPIKLDCKRKKPVFLDNV